MFAGSGLVGRGLPTPGDGSGRVAGEFVPTGFVTPEGLAPTGFAVDDEEGFGVPIVLVGCGTGDPTGAF